MQFWNKLHGEYDRLCNLIIRPERMGYPQPQMDILIPRSIKTKRLAFRLTNQNNIQFACSHFVPLNANSYPCVVYLHRNSSNQTEGMEYLPLLIKNNISLCTFDFGGCGNSKGEYITLGYNQWKEVEQVVNKLRTDPKVTNIALWGRSMGAVTALRYINNHPEIAAGIYDSPFKSLKSLVNDLAKRHTKIPGIIVSGLLKIVSKTIKEKVKFSIYDLNPLERQAPNIDVPGFFIVGLSDEIVPCEHSKLLFNAYKSQNKQLREVKGHHNDKRPESCLNEVIDFLKEQLFKQAPCAQPQPQPTPTPPRPKEEIDFFGSSSTTRSSSQTPTQKLSGSPLINDDDQLQMPEKQLDFNMELGGQYQERTNVKANHEHINFFAEMTGIYAETQKNGKVVNDGYEELRKRIQLALDSSASNNNNNKAAVKLSQKIAKELSNQDRQFQKVLSLHSDQFLW